MRRTCRPRHESVCSLSAKNASTATKPARPGIRNVLSSLRDERRAGEDTGSIARKSLSIRDLVRSRSTEFRSELGRLSHEQYMEKPVRQRLDERFRSESTTGLLNSVNASEDLQADWMSKVQEAREEPEPFDGFETYDESSMDEYSSQAIIKPGDFVEYWPDAGIRRSMVVLRVPKEQKRYTSISSRGTIDFVNSNRFRFIISNFIDGSGIPQEGSLREGDKLFSPIVNAMKKFKDDVAAFSTTEARNLALMYDNLPRRLKHTSNLVSVADVCKHMFQSTDPVKMYSVFAAMTTDRVHFLPDATLHMSIPLFSTRQNAEVERIKNVRQWTRTRSPEYRHFISQARKIAIAGREIVAQPSQQLLAVKSSLKFNETDRAFVEFMQHSCLERSDHPEIEIYTPALASIIKELNLVEDQVVTREAVHKTLKSLGIIAPWDANLKRSKAIALPGQNASTLADDHEAYLQKNFADNQVENLEILGLRDTCAELRHDFGNLPVYTIDGEGARELDDGLSIEGSWLHVHIADPSSFIKFGSKIADIAKFRLETSYLSDRTYPMLPTDLVQQHFSLKATGRVTGRPTMTTSIKLDSSGAIDEVLVRPGVIRNIRNTTYNEVDEIVFDIGLERRALWSISSNWSEDTNPTQTSRSATKLSQIDRQTILRLSNLLEISKQNRINKGLIDSFNSNRTTLIQPEQLPSACADHSSPIFFVGKPGILFSSSSLVDSPANALVTEAAILTNAAIARYSTQHKIPIIYKTFTGIQDPEVLAELLSKRDFAGRIHFPELMPYLARMGSAVLSLKPGPFNILGLPDGYTHATSPLRRFTDMVAQWHIQAHMKQAPFEVNLADLLPLVLRRGRALKQLDKSASRHWLLQLLQQKSDAGEDLQFEATVNINNPQLRHPSYGMLHGLGEKCLIEREITDPVMEIGSTVKVRITRLDLMDNVIFARRIDL